MSLPIRARMTAWYVALLALVVGAVGAFLVLRLRADLTDGLDRGLRPAVAQIAHDYRKEGPRELRDSAQTVLGGERVAAQVLDAGGEVVVAYGDPVAQVQYLQGHHLNGAWLLRDPTLLDHYRRHANRYFMQALETGEPSLIALWHQVAQAGENAALAEFLPEAWRTRGFVAALTDQLSEAQREGIFFPGMLDRRRVEPTPEELAEAARVFAQYFADMPAPPPRVERPGAEGAGFDPNRSLRRMLSEPGAHCRAQE